MSDIPSPDAEQRTPNAQLADLVVTSFNNAGFLTDDDVTRVRKSLEIGTVSSEKWRQLAAAKVMRLQKASTTDEDENTADHNSADR